MTWFERLTGINEECPEQVRQDLAADGGCIICPDGKRITYGHLETPKLSELRESISGMTSGLRRSTLREVVGDVGKLHTDPANADAMFQVASQFNLLEMSDPSITPEHGVGIYENDHTQGPACAIACGAGTIYRNYFAHVNGQTGQCAARQIDCSADLGRLLGNEVDQLWKMQNGYLFPSGKGLDEISKRVSTADEAERDVLLGELRIGLQVDAEVTLEDAGSAVTQAYCSALPVAYGRQPAEHWTAFAKLVLDAAYEATLAAAVAKAVRTGNDVVYLTLLGGGVFGNPDQWITDAIDRAFQKYINHGLDIRIVSYGRSKPAVAELVSRLGVTQSTDLMK